MSKLKHIYLGSLTIDELYQIEDGHYVLINPKSEIIDVISFYEGISNHPINSLNITTKVDWETYLKSLKSRGYNLDADLIKMYRIESLFKK